jgi:hypothetical protein
VPLFEAVSADIAEGRDAVDAVKRHVRALVDFADQHRALTLAFLAAAFDQVIKVGRVQDERDVRAIVPLVKPLIDLIEYGQATGVFRTGPSAIEIGSYQGNALLLCILAQPQGSQEQMIDFMLSQLLPALSN